MCFNSAYIEFVVKKSEAICEEEHTTIAFKYDNINPLFDLNTCLQQCWCLVRMRRIHGK